MECDLPDLQVAIVDEDQTPQSWIVGEVLDTQDFIDVLYMNRSEAAARFSKLTVHAILTLPQNYSTSQNASIEVDNFNPYFRWVELNVSDYLITFINSYHIISNNST